MLYINIKYNINTNKYEFDSNIKSERQSSIIEDFLRCQLGRGEDDRPDADRDEYNISINLHLSDDTFYSKDDCGNYGLRDGILLNALKSFPDKKD
jgi:hypothetical protein